MRRTISCRWGLSQKNRNNLDVLGIILEHKYLELRYFFKFFINLLESQNGDILNALEIISEHKYHEPSQSSENQSFGIGDFQDNV